MRALLLVPAILAAVSLPLGTSPSLAQGADKPATAITPVADSAAAAAIRTQFDGHVAAHRNRDPVAAAAMYADDVRLMGPDGDESRGKAALTAFYRDMHDKWMLDEYNYATEEIVAAGDGAYQIGLWWFRMHDRAGRVVGGRFTFMAVWRRDAAGSWKMERALWTPSAPDPAFGNPGKP